MHSQIRSHNRRSKFTFASVPRSIYKFAEKVKICANENEALEFVNRIEFYLSNNKLVSFEKEVKSIGERIYNIYALDGADRVKIQLCCTEFETGEVSVEVVRLSGCAFYLNYLFGEFFERGDADTDTDTDTDTNQLFRSPVLPPSEIKSSITIPIEEYELILERAKSNEDGCEALLSLILRDPIVLSRFKTCKQWKNTINDLKNDSNSNMNRVGLRLEQM